MAKQFINLSPVDVVALESDIRYDHYVVSVDDADVVAEAYLHDRVVNLVTIKNLAQTEMRFYFPPVVNGKVRDFAVVFTIDATDSQTDVAPPQFSFDNFTFVNAGGKLPEIASAPAGGKATTILYFSEVSSNVFLVKSEVAKEVA